MKRTQKAVLIITLLITCVSCDQATKTVAQDHLPTAQPLSLVGDTLRLQYTENSGALLGLGASLPAALRFGGLVVLVGAVLVVVLRFVWTSKELSPMGITGALLIVGGGLSNLLDRVLKDGAVIDFMNVGIGQVRTAIFNVADVFIMAGVGVLLAWSLFFRD